MSAVAVRSFARAVPQLEPRRVAGREVDVLAAALELVERGGVAARREAPPLPAHAHVTWTVAGRCVLRSLTGSESEDSDGHGEEHDVADDRQDAADQAQELGAGVAAGFAAHIGGAVGAVGESRPRPPRLRGAESCFTRPAPRRRPVRRPSSRRKPCKADLVAALRIRFEPEQ